MHLLLIVVAFFPAACAADAAQGPLSRDLRLNLWGVSLSETVREIHSQTGVEVKFHLADFPSLASGNDVYIITGRVPPWHSHGRTGAAVFLPLPRG